MVLSWIRMTDLLSSFACQFTIFYCQSLVTSNLLRRSRRRNIFSYFVCWRYLTWCFEPFIRVPICQHTIYLLDFGGFIKFFVKFELFNIHAYIHNWPLQPFSQDYDPVSHITLRYFIPEQCFISEIFILEIFKKLFHDRSIYAQKSCKQSAELSTLSSKAAMFSRGQGLRWCL